jgi:hypothetical protein
MTKAMMGVIDPRIASEIAATPSKGRITIDPNHIRLQKNTTYENTWDERESAFAKQMFEHPEQRDGAGWMEEEVVSVLLADQISQQWMALKRVALTRVQLLDERDVDLFVLLEKHVELGRVPSARRRELIALRNAWQVQRGDTARSDRVQRSARRVSGAPAATSATRAVAARSGRLV